MSEDDDNKREREKKHEEDKKQKQIDSELKNTGSSEGSNSAKSYGEILNEQIKEAEKTYDIKSSAIWMGSLAAGLEISFSYFLLCTLFGYLSDRVGDDTIFKLMGLVYPVGFILVIMGKSMFFTEQTSLLSLPVLNKKRKVSELLKLWVLVICGNLAGGCLMAVVLTWIGPRLHLFDQEAISKIAEHTAEVAPLVLFVSAVLAGWLMGLLSWILTSAQESISRIVLIFVVTSVIGFTGLHHSIIGNVEVFGGVITDSPVTFLDYLRFEGLALVGNAMGGVIFVGLLKYRAFVFNVGEKY